MGATVGADGVGAGGVGAGGVGAGGVTTLDGGVAMGGAAVGGVAMGGAAVGGAAVGGVTTLDGGGEALGGAVTVPGPGAGAATTLDTGPLPATDEAMLNANKSPRLISGTLPASHLAPRAFEWPPIEPHEGTNFVVGVPSAKNARGASRRANGVDHPVGSATASSPVMESPTATSTCPAGNHSTASTAGSSSP